MERSLTLKQLTPTGQSGMTEEFTMTMKMEEGKQMKESLILTLEP